MQSITSLYSQYLRCSGNRESTKESKLRALKFFIECHGTVDVERIKYVHGEDYRNFLMDRDCGENSVNLYVSHIKIFLKWLVKREEIKIDPWAELMPLPVQEKLTRPFTEQEILRMLDVSPLNWQVLILLGYCSGLRRGESLNLKREDFCFEKEQVEIRSKKKAPDGWKWDIKNRKTAFAPFPEYLNLASERIEYHQMVRALLMTAKHPYPTITKKHYQRVLAATVPISWSLAYGFDSKFKRICNWANVRRGNYQGLRVSFVNKLRKAKYDPKQVQVLARHKSLATTMRYYAFEDQIELVSQAVNCFKIL